MAAIILADVTGLCPDVTSVPQLILDWVNTSAAIDPGLFDDGEESITLKMMRCYLAAHMALTSATGGSTGAGPITSETEGGISRAYGTNTWAMMTPFGTSMYGLKFAQFARAYGCGARLA